MSKLTNAQRIYAIRSYKAAVPPRIVARSLGVTSECITMIARRHGIPRQYPKRGPRRKTDG